MTAGIRYIHSRYTWQSSILNVQVLRKVPEKSERIFENLQDTIREIACGSTEIFRGNQITSSPRVVATEPLSVAN